MLKMGTRLLMWNWWIGSTVMFHRHAPSGATSTSLFSAVRSVVVQPGAGDDSRGAHHVEHARDEAEQNKNNEPPWRDAEQPVDQPADAAADQHASNEFAREPEAPGVARCSRRPISTRTFGRRLGAFVCLAKASTETL